MHLCKFALFPIGTVYKTNSHATLLLQETSNTPLRNQICWEIFFQIPSCACVNWVPMFYSALVKSGLRTPQPRSLCQIPAQRPPTHDRGRHPGEPSTLQRNYSDGYRVTVSSAQCVSLHMFLHVIASRPWAWDIVFFRSRSHNFGPAPAPEKNIFKAVN